MNPDKCNGSLRPMGVPNGEDRYALLCVSLGSRREWNLERDDPRTKHWT